MRVSAQSTAISPRFAIAASLLAFASVLGACDGLVKKTPDACSVTVAPIAVTVPVNGSQNVVATAFDCDGNSITKRPPTFTSANPAIASVTAGGNIIGIAVGTTKVSATASGKSADVAVTVSPERVQTITVTPASVTIRKTNTRQLSAVAKNLTGTVISGITFVWASSNSSIAFVDNSGLVTGLAVGTVTITASADGQSSGSVVTVTEVPIGSITLTPTTQNILVGQQGVITPTLKDTAGNALSLTGRTLNWSSDNEVFATVSSTGVVTGKKAGTAKITATNAENTSVTSLPATVVITNPVISSVTISPVGGIVRLGVPKQYSVTLYDVNGATVPVTDRTITWRSVTPALVSVSSSGVVTALQTGNGARIAVDAEGKVDTVTFSVQKIPVATVTVSPLSNTVVEGQSKQLTPTVTDSVGNIVTDRVVEWASSDPTKASVSSTGLVTTLGSGTVTITANSETKSGSSTFTITPVPIDTIVVVANTFTLPKGTSSPFSITLRDAAGVQRRNRTVNVTSDQPSIATGVADAAATQVTVTGVAVGTATLTLQAVDANGLNQGKATKVIVTVTAATTP